MYLQEEIESEISPSMEKGRKGFISFILSLNILYVNKISVNKTQINLFIFINNCLHYFYMALTIWWGRICVWVSLDVVFSNEL